MKLILHTNVISPHQVPLAKELVKRFGADEFRYVYAEKLMSERQRMGWCLGEDLPWACPSETSDWDLESCTVLLSGIRGLDLFERRLRRGLKTLYMSERWFKPISGWWLVVGGWQLGVSVPGWVRMLVPGYRRMAKRFVKWITNDPNGRVLAIGPWARKDMLRLGVPESKIIPWGYFVAPSTQEKCPDHCTPTTHASSPGPSILKVLWVGRMIPWKRVDTIIRAVGEIGIRNQGSGIRAELTLVGDGPEKSRLRRLVTRMLRKINASTLHLHLCSTPISITFLPSQPIDKIREIMREHDVYVLASNAQEGWGAAINEALEEGMYVLGTYDAGSSATMLEDRDLFLAGDWKTLARKLLDCARRKALGQLRGQGIGKWSVAAAANRLVEISSL